MLIRIFKSRKRNLAYRSDFKVSGLPRRFTSGNDKSHLEELCEVRNQSRSRRSRGNFRAFTLVEFLLAITLFSIVSSSLYFSLRSALVLYNRSEKSLADIHETVLFFNNFSKEIRNVVRYEPVPFEGNETKFSFPVVLKSYSIKGVKSKFVKIEYEFIGGKLKRTESLIESPKEKIKTIVLEGKINKFSIKYSIFEDDEIKWIDKWEVDDELLIPKAVLISMKLVFSDKDSNKQEEKTVSKKIWIPHGDIKYED